MESVPPRFLVDRMLGKLAKWLRLLGYDAACLPQLSPQALIREARRQDRILLTRDMRICRRKDVPAYIFVQSDHFREQIAQVVRSVGRPDVAWIMTRCSACNELLQPVEKRAVQAHVPAYVWETQALFHRCHGCQRIYWPATHREHLLQELQDLGLLEHPDTLGTLKQAE